MGNPHAGFDAARAGNVTMGAGLRPRTKVLDQLPDPKVRAPLLDPTYGGLRRLTAWGLPDNASFTLSALRNTPPHLGAGQKSAKWGLK